MTLSIKQSLKKYENTALFSEYSKHVADNCTFFTFNYPYLVCMDVGGAVARDRRFGLDFDRSLTSHRQNLPDFDLAGTESRRAGSTDVSLWFRSLQCCRWSVCLETRQKESIHSHRLDRCGKSNSDFGFPR